MGEYICDVVVIGTGAAGYNAACRLEELGKNVVIVTEGVHCGTSRNTGSDKQTYYKLGLSGDSPDSVYKMAQNLFDGGCMDGDHALCEAALSARGFLHLCELGVPFPVNRYGEYVGYKTDHDPYARATSAGPLTSRFMTEALQKKAAQLQIPVVDGCLVTRILKTEAGVCGLLAIDTQTAEPVAFRCGDVIMATGGPAGIYADSVYPIGHTGTTSLALSAGAKGQNLSLWQYGLASTEPRWNVSGTYMQTLPRFVSVGPDGTEHEFLSEYFVDPYAALSMVFLKGYQWPFDDRKVPAGSSIIDLLVYRETVQRGRKVCLDYTKNPFGLEQLDFEKLSPEAYEYLSKAGACFGTPIQRLQTMNAPAIALYRSKGLDITTRYLPIALCAQHCNGGIGVDLWWQTDVKGLFAAGECAGTHGIARPGGSALNSGQVGSLRAAQYIARHNRAVEAEAFHGCLAEAMQAQKLEVAKLLENCDNVDVLIAQAQRSMSNCAGAVRDPEEMENLLEKTRQQLQTLQTSVGVGSRDRIWRYFKLKDILVTQCAVLTAMTDYARCAGESLEVCLDGSRKLSFTQANPETRRKVQQTEWTEEGFTACWRPVRPIPEQDDFFENVWRTYRENRSVY